jgi:hypothetical protein
MSGIQFHSTVMTPNGPGTVQGLLTRPGKPDALLISHEPKIFAPAELLARPGRPETPWGERISMECENPAIWILFAYDIAAVQPLNGRK